MKWTPSFTLSNLHQLLRGKNLSFPTKSYKRLFNPLAHLHAGRMRTECIIFRILGFSNPNALSDVLLSLVPREQLTCNLHKHTFCCSLSDVQWARETARGTYIPNRSRVPWWIFTLYNDQHNGTCPIIRSTHTIHICSLPHYYLNVIDVVKKKITWRLKQ